VWGCVDERVHTCMWLRVSFSNFVNPALPVSFQVLSRAALCPTFALRS
jgi:hypothetical protein